MIQTKESYFDRVLQIGWGEYSGYGVQGVLIFPNPQDWGKLFRDFAETGGLAVIERIARPDDGVGWACIKGRHDSDFIKWCETAKDAILLDSLPEVHQGDMDNQFSIDRYTNPSPL